MQLKADKSRVILTVDKGVAMVVVDQKDYHCLAKNLLEKSSTYRTISSDPTNKHTN